ncbi:hypothetical protein SAMN05421854_12346 [Amycolatopsis rubida]|uniref:Uncharacterized protein n=1 Tax=Amycolatopsis rubida TaxID=112413 RepID=A0A1I6B4P4_9PSEU|nr:hypothetical protein SAMN05421854_12346 [Amycolatopsis rubida]
MVRRFVGWPGESRGPAVRACRGASAGHTAHPDRGVARVPVRGRPRRFVRGQASRSGPNPAGLAARGSTANGPATARAGGSHRDHRRAAFGRRFALRGRGGADSGARCSRGCRPTSATGEQHLAAAAPGRRARTARCPQRTDPDCSRRTARPPIVVCGRERPEDRTRRRAAGPVLGPGGLVRARLVALARRGARLSAGPDPRPRADRRPRRAPRGRTRADPRPLGE